MTSHKDEHKKDSQLERALSGFGDSLSTVKSMVGGMYEQVREIAERTEAVYDAVSYQKDIPIFEPDEDCE